MLSLSQKITRGNDFEKNVNIFHQKQEQRRQIITETQDTNNGGSTESLEVLEMIDGKETKVADRRRHWIAGNVQDDQTSQVLYITNTLARHAVLTRTHTQLFYDPFSGITRLSQCQKKSSSALYGAREDNRGRHTDNLARRHSILTNQRPISIIPPFLLRMPSCRNPPKLSCLGTGIKICWTANPVAWFLQYLLK